MSQGSWCEVHWISLAFTSLNEVFNWEEPPYGSYLINYKKNYT